MNEPLSWTTKGNIPVSGLKHSVEWTIDDTKIVFVETYSQGDEIVKQSSHVKILTGVESPTAVGTIGE